MWQISDKYKNTHKKRLWNGTNCGGYDKIKAGQELIVGYKDQASNEVAPLKKS